MKTGFYGAPPSEVMLKYIPLPVATNPLRPTINLNILSPLHNSKTSNVWSSNVLKMYYIQDPSKGWSSHNYTSRYISIAIGSLMSFERYIEKKAQMVIVQEIRVATSLQTLHDGSGVLVGLGGTTEITGEGL